MVLIFILNRWFGLVSKEQWWLSILKGVDFEKALKRNGAKKALTAEDVKGTLLSVDHLMVAENP